MRRVPLNLAGLSDGRLNAFRYLFDFLCEGRFGQANRAGRDTRLARDYSAVTRLNGRTGFSGWVADVRSRLCGVSPLMRGGSGC